VEPLPLPSPVAVRLTSLLIPLMRLSGLVVVLGVIFAADAMTRAFFGTLTGRFAWIPYAGKVITSPLHKIEQKLTHYLGGLEQNIDVSMGGFFHNLAIVTEMLANGTAEVAIFDQQIVRRLRGTHNPAQLRPRISKAEAKAAVAAAIAARAARDAHSHGGAAATYAPRVVVPRVNALAHAIDVTIPGEIADLRGRVKSTEDTAIRAWRWVRSHPLTIGAGVFAGMLTYALGRIGAGWIRCSNVRRLGRAACGMNPNLLEAVLAGTLVIASPVSIVELTKACQAFTAEAEDGLKWFVRELK